MQKESIGDLLKYGEHISLECKKAEGSLPKSLWETYSAFANTVGGTILLGIEENPKVKDISQRFCIGTIKNPDQLLKDFWNAVNSEKVSSNVLVSADVSVEQYDGQTIIRIDVPQASYHQRPVYINGNPLKGSFKRNHEGDYHCTEEEVKSMLRDASDTGNDGGLLDGYTMDDIDLETLKAYRIEYELHNPDHVWNGIDNKSFLRNLGGYTVDRTTGKEGLTTAGLLMFGTGLAIRERFENIRMDYLDESNLTPERRWNDRLTYDGMWENNLYNFIKRTMPKLVKDIRRPFQLIGMSRIDDTPVHKAIREAVINLVIHADYHITGVLKIVKRDDGFLFSNPGNLKLSVSSIYEGGNSRARNPHIQTMLRMIGMGDNIGSGFPTILNAWNEENWRKPDLSENTELHMVELKLWTLSLMPQECTEYLHQLMGSLYDRLPPEDQIILCTTYLEGEITNSRIQILLNMHSTDVGKHLYELVQRNMLLVSPNGRWTTYRLNEEYKAQAEQLNLYDIPPSQPDLIDTDQLIYEFICENGFITTQQVVAITRITTTAGASIALNRLIKKELVEKKRNGRHIYYVKA
ncbi:RNA-binding domain-containing protein [Pseudoflavonifractor sp. An187]|uniref:RNA-binding domain-containing protein n=1 Tax=Pseudoflavonifractor sp. An187 TaxID=1965578 RepID=UPI000B39AEAD|nr:RNA-binding domain-containing protein [Pseudoflavonifractor sp. An187]OUP40142.1 AAA family ATPase [Pseudoflavonifractor sp. An187]